LSEAFDEEVFDRLVPEPPATREGLPPGYRMRHDAHYVDRLSEPAVPQVQLIRVKEIDGARPNAAAASRDLASLVGSINRFGLLQPLLVRRHNGRYNLIAGARRLAAAVAAGLTEVPCLVHEADDAQARALCEASNTQLPREDGPAGRGRAAIPAAALAEVSTHLDAIGSCLNLLPERDRALRERVAMMLMRAEVQRAAWLAQGLAVLAEDPLITRSPVALVSLLRHAVDAMQPEHALAALHVAVEVDGPIAPLHGDGHLISVALGGALVAMQVIAERVSGAAIRCTVRADDDGKTLGVEIAQSAVTLPASRLARFFDMSWADRPGGYLAAVGVVAARRIAELHAGKAEVSAGDQGGCTLRLEFPTELADVK
jgi:ParB-like chromosome segregation protein Spo0J